MICVALLVALSLATLIHLGLLASMRLDDQPERSRGRPPAHPCRCPVGVADDADGADARATFLSRNWRVTYRRLSTSALYLTVTPAT